MIKDIKSCLVNNSWQDIFFKLSTYFYVITFPLFLNLNTIALCLFVFGSVITFKRHRGFINLKENKLEIISFLFLFLAFVFGFFLSKDTTRVLKDIGRTLPLVIIPISVLLHRKSDFNFKSIYISLGWGLFIGMLICWFNIIKSILSRENYLKQASYFFEWIYTDANLVKPLGVHPSYFAVLLVLFISVLCFDKIFMKLQKNKLKLILILAPFFLFLIETNSRVGIISLIVIFLIHALKTFRIKLILGVVLLIFLTGLLSLKFNYLGSKFSKIISLNGEVKFERFQRWKEIANVFNEKDKLILGVGSGDARLVYRRAYYNGGFDLALRNNYNAHNQYLEFFVSNGILGLFIYLFLLIVFYKSTKIKGSSMHFFVVFILFSMTESFLGRSQGVMIFSFFYSILVLNYKPINRHEKIVKRFLI
ncbi:O-antigen ligase family protein [Cellulophaga sp. 20_2_10]|uniref:O-antigen ligase family protein n=1 Tax=Cellulophaga sp. 20_2_10 TaxID=2942476 RepID=UPI00201A8DB1|nr:O-antigen ligase family protein [Cellulophaga sp. 20_2_10]MCL5247331.1 O-antigen ligase family protein [Cellulophaga sp. 20_2_10]